MKNLAFFALAALLELAGCFAFWAWLRQGAPIWISFVGTACLIGFALALTQIEAAFAGRAYAAYGGIYVAASLLWLWSVEGQRPTATDLLGAGIAVAGALMIIGFALRPPPS